MAIEPRPGDPATLIIPGLVNAHTHLDLTMPRNSGALSESFTGWLLSVREQRLELGEAGLQRNRIRGIAESLAAGTTLVCDFDTSREEPDHFAGRAIRRLILKEVIDLKRAASAWDEPLRRFLAAGSQASQPEPSREVRGVAPHAPYTVSRALFEDLFARTNQNGLIAATHLAEQPYEREFLSDRTGPFADFFKQLGLDPEGLDLPDLDALSQLGLSPAGPPLLLIHGNYLTDAECRRLRASRASVVFCPQSFRWFGHTAPSLRRLRESGVRVIYGTDGKLSSGSLSMLDELKVASELDPELPFEHHLARATTEAHIALAGRFGSGRLEVGEAADFVCLKLPSPCSDERELWSQLSSGEVAETVIAGMTVNKPLLG